MLNLVWFLKMNECHLPESREQNIFRVQMCPLPRTRQLRLMTLQNRPFDFGGNINLYSILRLGLFTHKTRQLSMNMFKTISFSLSLMLLYLFGYSCTAPWQKISLRGFY